jgi:hypothetical protein
VKASGTPIGYAVRHTEVILPAQLLPIGLMVAGKHENNLYGRVAGMERVERVHQHGTSFDGDKLLGQLTAHAEALASSDDNGVVVHDKPPPY